MAHDEDPGPDTPAQGHLIAVTQLDGGLEDETEEALEKDGAAPAPDSPTDAEPASPVQAAPPTADADADADADSIAVTESPASATDSTLDLGSGTGTGPGSASANPEPDSPPSTAARPKSLIAATAIGILAIGGAVVATIGGSDPSTKATAPTADTAGARIPSAPGESPSSPWVWQTGQLSIASSTTPSTTPTPTTPTPTSAATTPARTAGQSPSPAPTTVPTTAPPRSTATTPGLLSTSAPPRPTSSASGPPAPPPTAPPATISLLTGPGCPTLPGGGHYSAIGSGTGSGWSTSATGGWTGDGCDGSMQSMPMTGDSKNGANRALWTFGSGTSSAASCVASVYVPWDGKATDTGGTAAQYQISEGSSDTVVANFTVDQNAAHGQWVTLGTVKVGGNSVKLRLLDHGDDSQHWRYGVSAAKVQCTS